MYLGREKIVKKIFIIGFVLAAISFSSILVSFAYTVQKDGDAPNSIGDFTPKYTEESYVNASNTFSGQGIKYYLITHDETKSNLTSLTYLGVDYSLESVVVNKSNDIDFKNVNFSNKDGTTIKLLNYAVPSKDFTIFFDDGLFNNVDSTDYTVFSKENASYIGLNKDINGEPLTVISKNPRSGTGNPNIDDKMERWIFMHKNIYLENLKFDGKNKDMYPVGGGSGTTKVPKNRGEYFFTITGGGVEKGCDGFVMRNIILENIGSDNTTEYPSFWGVDTRNKNIALNILYNPGQINIENVKIRNIKTTEGYGIIQNEYVSDLFYRDISIDSALSNSKSRSIKIEQSGTQSVGQPTYVSPENQSVIFAGIIDLPEDTFHNHIYVQDYRYKYIGVPEDFRYAVWNMSNGNYFNASFELHKEKPNTADNRAIQDLIDNYWVIDGNKNSTVGIQEQLDDIFTVMNYAKTVDNKNRAPQANIKLVTKTVIPSFVVPSRYSDMNVNIVAQTLVENLHTNKNLVSVETGAIITLPINNNIKLYNFDFHTNANYTLKEVIQGIEEPITPVDPGEIIGIPGYPIYTSYYNEQSPKVINSNENTFINNKFTVVAKNLQITTKKSTLVVGSTTNEVATLNNGVSLFDNIIGSKIDDSAIVWFSSDSNIATIDSNGVLTTHAMGDVTIYAKARDIYNQGEIEKPFDSYVLSVVENTAPTIVTQNMIVMQNDSTFKLLDLVISASDKEDTSLSKDNVVIESNGNFDISVLGTYSIIYSVTDSGGLTTQNLATVTVISAGPPLINTHNTSIVVGTIFEEDDLIKLVDSAYDYEGTDIKNSVIIIEKGGFDYNIEGYYTITYAVTYKNGVVGTNTSLIQVLPVNSSIDFPPSIITHGITIYEGSSLNLLSLVDSALDQNGSDLTNSVTYDNGGFNANIPNTYIVTYKVEDINTNLSTLSKAIVIVKPRIPTISANGTTITVGESLDLMSLVTEASDPVSGNLKGSGAVKILSDGGFNKEVVGHYDVTFIVTNEINKSSTITVTVHVQTKINLSPTITAHNVTIKKGENLNLLSLIDKAEDPEDGDIKEKVVVESDGGFNKNIVGSYKVTFVVKDKEGLESRVTVIVYVENLVDTVEVSEKPRTCQDDGYPEGYYWSYEKNACIIDSKIITPQTKKSGNDNIETPIPTQKPSPTKTSNSMQTPSPTHDEITPHESTPEVVGRSWALINLIASLIGVLLTIVLLFAKHEKEEENEENQEVKDEFERKRIYKVIGVIVAVVSIIVFLLTENITLPMKLVDKYTLLMIAFALGNIVCFYFGRKWHEVEDEEVEEQN
ncbi:MAG: hypothetical protein RR598_04150 [Anaerorhabdus sp.]|uniref:hypothetical protein n=1 Tax=Anaerorhabdus sp. TaxID=1872524 RepID=UPI002FC6DE68